MSQVCEPREFDAPTQPSQKVCIDVVSAMARCTRHGTLP